MDQAKTRERPANDVAVRSVTLRVESVMYALWEEQGSEPVC